MGIFDRFRKKDAPPEVSDGGSVIHRYSAEEWAQTPVGFAETSAESGRIRDEVYLRRFGTAKQVWHETIPLIPHIDVMEYYRTGKDRIVCTLVTSGMSDLPMRIPPKAETPARVELIFYCTDPKPAYVSTLRFLAHFAHDQKTWIAAFHTIPMGNQAGTIMESAALDTIFLLPPIVQKDQDLAKDLILDGDGVEFVWVVPISAAECKLKLDKGSTALLDVFQENRHPYIFDPSRKSYL
jgi:hypothetical protein